MLENIRKGKRKESGGILLSTTDKYQRIMSKYLGEKKQ